MSANYGLSLRAAVRKTAGPKEGDMTAETVSGQTGARPGGSAEPGSARPGLPDRMARHGIWIALITHIVLHDRRFQAAVITGVIGAYALGSVTKNNQARPMRRVTAWCNLQGRSTTRR
jgi:hypothetical protein